LPKEADDDAENETPHRNRPEGNVMDPVLVLAVYLLPGIIAVIRGHRSTGRMVTLRQHVTKLLLPWAGALPIPLPELVRSGLRVRAYGSDPRLPEWTETFIVSLRHYGVVGFCNRLPR
jgi:hypothetical protein